MGIPRAAIGHFWVFPRSDVMQLMWPSPCAPPTLSLVARHGNWWPYPTAAWRGWEGWCQGVFMPAYCDDIRKTTGGRTGHFCCFFPAPVNTITILLSSEYKSSLAKGKGELQFNGIVRIMSVPGRLLLQFRQLVLLKQLVDCRLHFSGSGGWEYPIKLEQMGTDQNRLSWAAKV